MHVAVLRSDNIAENPEQQRNPLTPYSGARKSIMAVYKKGTIYLFVH